MRKVILRLKNPSERIKIEMVDKSAMDIECVVRVKIELGNVVIEWDVLVADIGDEGLLGADFLYAHDYTLTASGGLKLGGVQVPTSVENWPVSSRRVVIAQNTVVPAFSESVVAGTVLHNNVKEQTMCLLEPVQNQAVHNDVLVGNVLVCVGSTGRVPVRLMNVSHEDVTLHEGTLVGHLKLLRKVESICKDKIVNEKSGEVNHITKAGVVFNRAVSSLPCTGCKKNNEQCSSFAKLHDVVPKSRKCTRASQFGEKVTGLREDDAFKRESRGTRAVTFVRSERKEKSRGRTMRQASSLCAHFWMMLVTWVLTIWSHVKELHKYRGWSRQSLRTLWSNLNRGWHHSCIETGERAGETKRVYVGRGPAKRVPEDRDAIDASLKGYHLEPGGIRDMSWVNGHGHTDDELSSFVMDKNIVNLDQVIECRDVGTSTVC